MAPRGDMTQWLGSRVLRCRFSFFGARTWSRKSLVSLIGIGKWSTLKESQLSWTNRWELSLLRWCQSCDFICETLNSWYLSRGYGTNYPEPLRVAGHGISLDGIKPRLHNVTLRMLCLWIFGTTAIQLAGTSIWYRRALNNTMPLVAQITQLVRRNGSWQLPRLLLSPPRQSTFFASEV
jgi:hypothetical protein